MISSSLSLLSSPFLLVSSATEHLGIADSRILESSATSFEPILNVPAFAVFLLIVSVFAALQWRVTAIEQAAKERNIALKRLRQVKATELSDPTATLTPQNIKDAVSAYQQAYWKVERLRTVIPGIARILPPPPPSQLIHREDGNAAAALQFLGIEPDIQEQESSAASAVEGTFSSALLTGVLIVIALSHLALLLLFVTTDPMAPTSLLDDATRVDAFGND